MTRWLALACRGQWGSPGVARRGRVASADGGVAIKRGTSMRLEI